jgi:hypothetical protein
VMPASPRSLTSVNVARKIASTFDTSLHLTHQN